eukprot:TRINITY_DN6505_c0_g1_i2.p1 TRINITY_DN6505_c0_g1~~TRINITY_DN6505_c0_g1_i2.p1  ORF type:complete len:107 (+),score=2.58 TRINITY_DN6505_c0_g1_i2:107-427(+)
MRVEVTADYWAGWFSGWQQRHLVVDEVYLHIKMTSSAATPDETFVLGSISGVATYNDRGQYGVTFQAKSAQFYLLFDDIQTQLVWLRALRGEKVGGKPQARLELPS